MSTLDQTLDQIRAGIGLGKLALDIGEAVLRTMLDDKATPAQIAELRHTLGNELLSRVALAKADAKARAAVAAGRPPEG